MSAQPGPSAESARQFLGRLQASYSDTYLTLISIIQGATLSLLVMKTEVLAHGHSFIEAFPLDRSLLFLSFLLIIVLVWNEYRMGITLYNWIPQLRDALILFALGAVELLALLRIDEGSALVWAFWCLAGLFVLGALGFENQYRQATNAGINAFALEVTRGFRRTDIWACAISGAGCVAGALVAALPTPRLVSDACLSGFLVLACLVHLGRQSRHWHAVVARTLATSLGPGS